MLRSNILLGLVRWLRRHAAEDRNSITVTIAPAQAERTFQIDLPRWSLRLLGVILVASFVLVLAGGILYGKLIRDSVVLREIRQENEVLRARAARLSEIEQDVAQLDRVRRQLYALAGVKEAEAGTPGAPDEERMATQAGDSALPEPIVRNSMAGSGSGDGSLTGGDVESPVRVAPFRGPISRGFSEVSEKNPEHSGIDVAGRMGAEVVAAGSGMITFAGTDETFGNLVIIRHVDGWETRYGHNEIVLVAEGDSVVEGQVIAHLGNTGKSSAPHLHFEVHHQGRAVDPGTYIRDYRPRF